MANSSGKLGVSSVCLEVPRLGELKPIGGDVLALFLDWLSSENGFNPESDVFLLKSEFDSSEPEVNRGSSANKSGSGLLLSIGSVGRLPFGSSGSKYLQ